MALSLDHESILNTLIEKTAERLELKLKTEIVDDAKAGLVRPGKLQQNPIPTGINILVHYGGNDWPDILNTESKSAGKWVNYAYEIGGGGILWRRRFKVEFELYFSNEKERSIARPKAQVVMSRAMNALLTWRPANDVSVDSFGESVYDIQIREACINEGGGTGTFIWRGDLKIEFLTSITPIEV